MATCTSAFMTTMMNPDHEHEHKYSAATAEYVRLGLMALVVVASLTGWWRHWM